MPALQNNLRKSKIFYKYLFSYIAVLILPLLFIWFFAYNYFIEVLECEIINTNVDTMNKVKNSIDIQLNALRKIYNRLQLNEKLRPYYIQNNTINQVEVQKILNNYAATNDFIHEIIFYIRNDEYMYSSASSYTISTFTNHVYNYTNWDTESFYYDINNITVPVIRPRENVINNHIYKIRFITYIYPVPAKSINPYATLIFVIDENAFRNMIVNVFQKELGNTIILDNNGNIITSLSDDDYLKSSQFLEMVNDIEGYGSLTKMIDNMEYFVSYVKSIDSGWTYITMVPYRSILSKVTEVKIKVIYTTITIIFLGGIIIYLFTYLNYNPLKKLWESAKKNGVDIPQQMDEIEAAQMAIIRLARTSTSLSNKIISNRQAIKEFLLLNLLKGSIKSVDDFNEKGRDANITLTKPFFRVVIFWINSPDYDYAANKDIISEIENKFINEIHGYGKDNVEKDKIIFVLAEDNISDSTLEVQLLFLQQYLKEKWGLQSTIAVGNRCSTIDKIGKSYIEALSAMDYRLIKGNNKVIFFKEISNISTMAYYPKESLDCLELAILEMDVEKISSLILEMVKLIKETQTPLFMAKCLCFDIVNTVIKTTQHFNMNFLIPQKELPNVLCLTKFQTVDELANLVIKICFNICEYVAENPNGDSSNLLEKIISYMEQHFRDYNFSIQRMAEHFGMSSSNISHFFKKHTNKTLSEYVTYMRIEAAKELLSSTDKNLKEVVESIGYIDVSSFIKKFKDVVGSTPGDFRKSYNNY